MYYLNPNKNENGGYLSPQSYPISWFLKLPDELLPAFIEAKGFVNVEVENATVVGIEPDTEALAAYEAWVAEQPVLEEPVSVATAEDVLNTLLGVNRYV